MNKADRTNLQELVKLANRLIDAGNTGSGITNMDVLEAVLDGIEDALSGNPAKELAKLVERDNHVCDYTDEIAIGGCTYACKIYRCKCSKERIIHNASYGCPRG